MNHLEIILDKNAIPVIKKEKYKVVMMILIGVLKYRRCVKMYLFASSSNLA
jgi:hypothetical protein